ncbi:MAG: YlmH/Sll1252 family protein [Oscillospiraceae bacterium]|nr:YlmH/Sll1252 family protein [Oscillospiraceae bacterium]
MELKPEDKLILSRAEDVIERCRTRHILCSLGFLSPAQRGLLERALPKSADVCYAFWGGHDAAERTMFVCYPDYMEFEAANVAITALQIVGRDIGRLSHRDFLGSVLALGIKREKIGDILVASNQTLMFVAQDIAEYICENLAKIGNAGVSVTFAGELSDELPDRAVEFITGTVANVRLDAVLGLALKMSRSSAAEYITSERVQVNWAVETSLSHRIDEGDIFSVKGKGRFRLKTIGNLSKKGRYHITIEKYL